MSDRRKGPMAKEIVLNSSEGDWGPAALKNARID